MAKGSDVLKRNAKVVAVKELDGVARGTPGKVIISSGVTWLRYLVEFENGRHVAGLDRKKLATPDEWERKKDLPDEADEAADEGTETAAAAEIGEGGIPAHLLERSRRARERLTGSPT